MQPLTRSLFLLGLLAPSTPAQDEAVPEIDSLQDAIQQGRTWIHLNYRVEFADQDTFDKDALASTLRTALGFESASYHGFRGLIEFEDISNLGNDIYNSTTNGEANRPVVADPNSTEVNQVYAAYTGLENFELKIGRQEIIYGNHRFVGNVAWRQNHQSFDAVRADWSAPSGTNLSYAYLDTVNRIFGEDNPAGEEQMASHLLDLRHTFEGVGDFAAYGYLLDFDDSQALSSTTVGARLFGSQAVREGFDVMYTGEYAHQVDSGDNPVDIDADYWLAEVGVKHQGIIFKLGNEHLGGSGDAGDKFSTPLATLHKFNGFADLFLNTPDTGLEDRYAQLSGKIGPVKCAATYHIFESDSDGIDYGKEIDFTALYPVTERMTLGAKYAQFDADDAFTDTTRAMAWITYKLL